MKGLKNVFVYLFLFCLAFLFFLIKPINAQNCSELTINGKDPFSLTKKEGEFLPLEFFLKIQNIRQGDTFIACTGNCMGGFFDDFRQGGIIPTVFSSSGGQTIYKIEFKISENKNSDDIKTHQLHIRNEGNHPGDDYCTLEYKISESITPGNCNVTATSEVYQGKKFTPNTTITVEGGVTVNAPSGYRFFLQIVGPGVSEFFDVHPSSTGLVGQYSINIGRRLVGSYKAYLVRGRFVTRAMIEDIKVLCQDSFCISDDGCSRSGSTGTIEARDICEADKTGACFVCFSAGDTWTALGCIPTSDLTAFVGWTVGKIIFVASGIAFLLMAFGAFQILTSSGDPKKVQSGQELITSAVSGLLFIILSLFLLKLIGVDILQIPGFSK